MKVASNRRRLDVFTLDLLEEWTALHGSLVWRQVVASCASVAPLSMCNIAARIREY